MNLQAWFEKGLKQHEYIFSMETHKENLLKVYNEVNLDEDEKTLLQGLQKEQLKAVILTADWCGDAMVNLPIFMRIADEALLEARYLIRDENLELMDQYLTNGNARSIPIIIFLDKDGNEIGKWGPRAPQVQEKVDTLKEKLPVKESADYEQAFKEFVKEISILFTTDRAIWADVKGDLIQGLTQAVPKQ
ncbi:MULTISPECIES: thioredoxin family protein [Bacillus]|uniref:Thioredoxin n=2 Tax=Bacillus TaxID=1386 RepID=A0A0M4G6C5_9BACI|nr:MULTISPECIES: thioredoxin family protein [Bacillus]ALC80390.1 thioredoxin [Bacillus gobiensis]MBP1083759.1 hypothetical protein [Bacillus capparidis]MED1098244.1 thioredoxin family protein [Bacillus capparidis]